MQWLSINIGLLIQVDCQVFNMVSDKTISLILDLISLQANVCQIVLHLDQLITKLFTDTLFTVEDGKVLFLTGLE